LLILVKNKYCCSLFVNSALTTNTTYGVKNVLVNVEIKINIWCSNYCQFLVHVN